MCSYMHLYLCLYAYAYIYAFIPTLTDLCLQDNILRDAKRASASRALATPLLQFGSLFLGPPGVYGCQHDHNPHR